MRETLEKSKLHELKLLTRQSAKRGTHTLLPSPRVEIVVAAIGRIWNGEEIFGGEATFATSPFDVDASVARDLKHPGDGRRPATVIKMGFLPDRFHNVLCQILCRRRSQTKTHKLRLDAWPKVVEQQRESLSVAACADSGEQVVKLTLSRGRTTDGVIIEMSAEGQIHDIPQCAQKCWRY